MKELKANLSGSWTIHWAPYLLLLPITVLVEPVVQSVSSADFFLFTIASFLGYLTLLAWLGISWFTFYRNGNADWWLILPISIFAGFLLNQSIRIYASLFGLEGYALDVQWLSPTLLVWGIGIPIVGYVMNKLSRFIKTRDEMVRSLTDKEKPRLVFEIDQEFRELLTGNQRIDRDGYEVLAQKIREFTEREVRPVSHKLWLSEVNRKSKFPLFALVKLSLIKNEMPVVLYSTLALWLMLVAAIGQYGALVAIGFFLIDALVFIASLLVYKRFFRKRSLARVFLFPPIASTLIFLERTLVRPSLEIDQIIGGWVVLTVWLFTALLFAGGVVQSEKTQKQILSELEENLKAGERLSQLQAEVSQKGAGDLAKFIHGTVQSKLMAYSLQLEQANEDKNNQEASRIRELVGNLIANPLAEYEPETNQSMQASLSAIAQQWQGLVDVRLEISGVVEGSRAIEEIVSEGVSNAYKHGYAEKVDVLISDQGEHLLIEITDDGIGPRSGKGGFGLQMVKSVTAGNWSFERSDTGEGSTLRAMVPKEGSNA